MATFDESLQTYREKREELRALQGEIQIDINQYEQMGKAIGTKKRRYNVVRKQMMGAHDALIPELKKEAAAHPVMDAHAKPDELPKTDAEVVKMDGEAPAAVTPAPEAPVEYPSEEVLAAPGAIGPGGSIPEVEEPEATEDTSKR